MFRKAMASDDATLSIDFSTGTLPSGMTLTRGTSGTYINESGFLSLSISNTARFDYTGGSFRGLLIEAEATNLLTYSEAFTPSWTDSSITRDSTGATSPRNSAEALQVTASAGNATIIRSAAIGSSAQRTFSIWLRRNSGSGNVQYTLDNGGTWTTQAITSTWTRYIFPATTANHQVGIRIVTSGDSIELFGAMLEVGSGASSYIKTIASTVNRQADFAVISDISAIGFNTAGGSLAMRGYQTKLSSGSYPALAAFLDSGDVDVFGIRNDVAGAVMFGRFAGTSTSSEAFRTITNNAAYAFGMSVNPALTTSAIIVSMNGSSTTANKTGSATAISTPTKFALTRPGYGLYINCGAITSIKYWSTVKTAAELNAITT
jgi:hypothetical protein